MTKSRAEIKMEYRTFTPCPELAPIVKCYWTLEMPVQKDVQRQRIVPDGCIEMAFILGDDIKRYTSGNEYILQPRAMVLGQTLEPFYIEPTGYVNTFAVRFYPYSFSNFVTVPIKNLANKETALSILFGSEVAEALEQKIINTSTTNERIEIIERFLLNKLSEKSTIDIIVKKTVETLIATKGSKGINSIVEEEELSRRQLERKFSSQVGLSPKQLGKVIRMQAALKILLEASNEKLTSIAYESEYYDQAHFIKDFKEFTGATPKDFLLDESLTLSTLFYKED